LASVDVDGNWGSTALTPAAGLGLAFHAESVCGEGLKLASACCPSSAASGDGDWPPVKCGAFDPAAGLGLSPGLSADGKDRACALAFGPCRWEDGCEGAGLGLASDKAASAVQMVTERQLHWMS
jgi:hypothetical protein